MAKGGAGFLNFHEKRKQYWAEYTWKDHIQFSTACCQNSLGSESMLLHGQYADRYTAAYDNMVEIQQTGGGHQKCHTKDIKILEAEELEARELIIDTWDMEAALHAWHAEDMFETVGLRPLGDDMIGEIMDTVAKVVETYQGNRQKEWIGWKSRFEEVCSMEDGKSRRIKQWALLKATPGTEDEPGLWQSWLSEFRFKTRLRMKLGRTRELYRDSVHLLASQMITLVGDGNWDTPECERLRLFLCRSIQDLSDIEFRQRLRANTAPPAFSDSDYMELSKSYMRLKEKPSLVKALSGISLLHSFLDGCLDDVPWDRICEGYVWHWIEFIMKLKPDVYVLGFSVAPNLSLEALRRFTTEFEVFQGIYLQELMDACRPQLDGLPTASSMPVDAAANLAPQARGKRKGKRKRKQAKKALEKTQMEGSAELQSEDMLVAALELASDTHSGSVRTSGDIQSDGGLVPQSKQQQTTTKDNTLAVRTIEDVGGDAKGEEVIPALGPIEGRESQQYGEDLEVADSCNPLGQPTCSDSVVISCSPPFTSEYPVMGCRQQLKEFELCREDTKTVRSGQIIPCLDHQSTQAPGRGTGGDMSGVARRFCNTELETGIIERREYGVMNGLVLSATADNLLSQECLEGRDGMVQCRENAESKQLEEVTPIVAESCVLPELTAAGSVEQPEHSSTSLTLEKPTNDVNTSKGLQLDCSGRNAIEEFDFDEESLLNKDDYRASTRGKKCARELKTISEGGSSGTAVGATLAENGKIVCRVEDLKDYNASSGIGQVITRSNVASSGDRAGRVTTPTTNIVSTSRGIVEKEAKIWSKADQKRKTASPQGSAGRLDPSNFSDILPKEMKPDSRNVSNQSIVTEKIKLVIENDEVTAEELMHSAELSGTENGSWSVVREKRKGKKKASVTTTLPEESSACEAMKGSGSNAILLQSDVVKPRIRRGGFKNHLDWTVANVGCNGPKPVQLNSEPTPTRGPIAEAVVNPTPKRTVEPPVRSNSQPKSRGAGSALLASQVVPVMPINKHQDEQAVSQKTHVVEHKTADKPINRPFESHHRARLLSLPGSSCEVRMVGDKNKPSPSGRTIWFDSHVALKSLFEGSVEDLVLPQEEGPGLSNKFSSTCQQTMQPAALGSANDINPTVISLAKTTILGTESDGADTPTPYSLILKRSGVQRIDLKEKGQAIPQQDTKQLGTLETMASTKLAIGVEGEKPIKSPKLTDVPSENDERSLSEGAKTTSTNGGYSCTKLLDNNNRLQKNRQKATEEKMLGVYKRLAQEDIAALSGENDKLRDLISKLIDSSAEERCAAMVASHRAIGFVKLQSSPTQDREILYRQREKDQPSNTSSYSTLNRLTVAEDEESNNGPAILSLPKDEPKPSLERLEAYSRQAQSRRIPRLNDKWKGRNTRETQPRITHILQRETHISSNIEANLLPGVKAQAAGSLSYRSSKKTSRLKNPITNIQTYCALTSGGSATSLNPPMHPAAENQLGEIPVLMTAPDGQPIYTSSHFRGPLVVPGLRLERFSESISSRVPLFQPHN